MVLLIAELLNNFIVSNRNSLFVTHRVEEFLLGMFVMGLFVRLRLDLGSWNCV